jgi:hypothetical protein
VTELPLHESFYPIPSIISIRYTINMTKNTKNETFEVKGDDLLAKVKELIHQGNIRKIIIKDKEGNSIIELPLTIGVVGAVLAPPLAAVGAIAALVSECTITVERKK